MTDTLITLHSLFQYVALIGVVIGAVAAARSQPPGSWPFTAALWALRIQVVLGVLVWLFAEGWSAGVVQGWIHPLSGIAAVGAVEAMTARARREGATSRPILTGYVIAAVLVVVAIGLAEAA